VPVISLIGVAFSIWLVIGLVIYGVYGYRHSRLNANRR
jgi:hypothetical protein